jgi:small nuclear ribonucleoprotein (snRNP)-like protein
MGCRSDKNLCKNDCLCRLLRNFRGQEVTIRTRSGETITGTLEAVTDDCCVEIIEPSMMTPFIGERLTVIRCKDIESFSVELLT